MRFRSLAASLALVLGGVPGVASATVAAVAGERCADVKVRLRNLKVEAKWVKTTVAVGDTAQLKVLVTRTAEEDPVTDEGEPYPTGRPMDEPAEDVVLGTSLLVGDVYLPGREAVTDAEGRATLKIKIKGYTQPGTGTGRVYGEKTWTPPDFPSPTCRLIVYEWGALDPTSKLKVVR